MEHEIRFYYPKIEYSNWYNTLNDIQILKCNGKKYEKTIQYNHPNKEFDFYSKKIDGRFRVRLSKCDTESKLMISWKRRLPKTSDVKINTEEEVELSINPLEYDNLIFLLNNVLHMNQVECYERYRTTFSNSEVEIALDEYPFGLALEIESKDDGANFEKVIDKYMELLGLDYNDSYKLSWDDKYEELCHEQNVDVLKDVLFENDMPEIK